MKLIDIKLGLALFVALSICVIASNDSNSSQSSISVDSNLSRYIIDDGSDVINNQHTEQYSSKEKFTE